MRRIAFLALALSGSWLLADDCKVDRVCPPLAIVVRPTDIDDKGHVNHAKHVEYLQWARWDWLSKMNVSAERIRKDNNVALVVVNVNLDYKREIGFGETVFVKTTIDRVGDKSVTFRQKILENTISVVAEGTVTMVSIDLATRKSCQLPKPWVDVFRPSDH